MKLDQLLKYEEITIQTHDNPDADAIASGYALYMYFKDAGKKVRLIYSGTNRISKANLVLMVEKLFIPIDYVTPEEADSLNLKGLLITVDCQYGAGNVTKIQAESVAIIDHHQIEITNIKNTHILPDMGSCSTVVWLMLKEVEYEVTDTAYVGTALYYGLLTDTNHFSEIHNPYDRDAQDLLPHNNALVTHFCNSNLSIKELEIAGIAMLRYMFNDEYKFAIIKAQPCDPNILGLISDFLLQVDQILTCVVYNETDGGLKLSVRSCVREVNASELAAFITKDIGSGGGHFQKAGGFISRKLYEETVGNTHSEAFFSNRMIEYFENYDLVYADRYEADLNDMKKYQKKNIPVGFVRAKEVLPVGTPITIRTLEGDIDMMVEDDLIIMIGINGEVYPNHMDKFQRNYKVLDQKYNYSELVYNNLYEPVVKNRLNGKSKKLTKYAGVCVATGQVQIYAKPLEKAVKVFTSWDPEKYMVGKIGDMLAVRTDDMHDVYVVDREIFDITYGEV